MMDKTDRHCRFFLRMFSPNMLLYTEMVTSAAILRGDRERLLGFDATEHPVALQLGGSEPADMAESAAIGADFGYDEININVGCPSDRVQSGSFGACLMREPERVADCVAAMRARVSLPVTVKTRIGVESGETPESNARALQYDESDYARLQDFVTRVAAAGCETFIIHARKAVLKGFSPRDNREIPPLHYAVVARLKRDFPHLTVIANGGVRETGPGLELLKDCDGLMIGREAYNNPYLMASLEQGIRARRGLPEWQPPSRDEVLERLAVYAEQQIRAGHRLHSLTRHIAGLFAGQPGARSWRRFFSEHAGREDADADLLFRASERLRAQQAA